MNLLPEKKIAGVLVPLFALRGEQDLGIGDVAALRELIDWAAGIGFKLVQLLPINEIGSDNSPYNAISAVAIEPTTLRLAPNSPHDLTREDFDASVAEVDLPQLSVGRVKYRQVKELKRRLLEKAFTNFSTQAGEERRSRFRAFCEQQSAWLSDYALFRVLMEANNDSAAWNRWQPQHQTIEKARTWLHDLPQERQAVLRRRAEFFCYVQWIAHQQWCAIKSYAEERGVALMGDIPFGVSYCSADVFARPGEFMLDWFGGAPPEPYFKEDAFTQRWGQNWGIPLYQWEKMRANNFQWWRERLRAVRRVFHLCRIDHIQGFYRIYGFPWQPRRNKEFLPLNWLQMLQRTGGRAPHFVPRDDNTPENRELNKREGEEYLRVVLEEIGIARVIGEDLGVVPEYVRPNLRSLGIAGLASAPVTLGLCLRICSGSLTFGTTTVLGPNGATKLVRPSKSQLNERQRYSNPPCPFQQLMNSLHSPLLFAAGTELRNRALHSPRPIQVRLCSRYVEPVSARQQIGDNDNGNPRFAPEKRFHDRWIKIFFEIELVDF